MRIHSEFLADLVAKVLLSRSAFTVFLTVAPRIKPILLAENDYRNLEIACDLHLSVSTPTFRNILMPLLDQVRNTRDNNDVHSQRWYKIP